MLAAKPPVSFFFICFAFKWIRPQRDQFCGDLSKILITYILIPDKFSGGYGVATGGPLAWGLCYNKELSPESGYCDDYYKLTYPCAPGAAYYGRGALPIYWYA
jgi:hypothetical protein